MKRVIGMIGLGNMGLRIAEHLVTTGNQVLGFDTAPKEGEGIVNVELETLVERSDYILMSLPNSRIIEDVIFGEKGVLKYIKEPKTIIDLSSASPRSSQKISAELRERGISYLDAPVSGGTGKAANGTLTIMAGGEKGAFDNSLDVLNQIGTSVHYMGDSGTGDAMKAINNFLTAITLAATGEAMIVAKQAGLNLEQVLEILNSSSGASYATSYRFPKIIKGDYIEGGLSNNLMIKDVEIYKECAQQLNIPVLIGDSTASIFRLAVGAGKGGQVSNRIVDVLGDLCGGVRLAD